jgi:hypothetical protein
MTLNQDPELAKSDLKTTCSASSAEAAPIPIEGETHHLPTYEHEKALTWKFDLRMLPILAVMYLFNALDKGNLGNAKTDGMDKDLGFKGNQYNTMLSVSFVPNSHMAYSPQLTLRRYSMSRMSYSHLQSVC